MMHLYCKNQSLTFTSFIIYNITVIKGVQFITFSHCLNDIDQSIIKLNC